MICGSCGHDNSEQDRFCSECGATLESEQPQLPVPKRRSWWLIALAAVLVLAVVAGIVIWQRATALPPTATEVTVADGGVLELDDGTRVTIPPGAISEDTVLRATPSSDPIEVEGLVLVGPAYEFELDAGSLQGEAEIQMPVAEPEGWPADADFGAWVSSYDDGQWTPADVIAQSPGAVTVTTSHFSLWAPWTWDFDYVRDLAVDELAELSGSALGDPPECPDESGAEKFVQVEAPNAEHVQWCLDEQAGDHVLRIRNPRNYGVTVSWSGPASLVDRPEYDASLASLLRWAESRMPTGRNSTTLPPGSTAVLKVSPTRSSPVQIDVEWNGALLAVSTIESAANVALALRKAAGVDTTVDELLGDAGALACLTSRGDELVEGVGLGDVVATTSGLFVDCFAEMVAAGGQSGVVGLSGVIVKVAVGIIGGAVTSVVGWAEALPAVLRSGRNFPMTVSAVRPDSVSTPDGWTWLYDVPSNPGLESGAVTVESRSGPVRFANATRQWVGCDGDASEYRVRLNEGFLALRGSTALRPGTPESLEAKFTITADGSEVFSEVVGVGDVVPVELDVKGVDVLVVAAEREAGKCEVDSVGYGIWGDAALKPDPEAEPPSGGSGGWPTDDMEGTPAFFAYLGASFIAPAWSSCTADPGGFCLVGSGRRVIAFNLQPIDRAGTIPVDTPDPLQALLDMGASRAAALEALSPGSP